MEQILTDFPLASRITRGFDYSLSPTCNMNSANLWEWIVSTMNVMYQSNHLYLIGWLITDKWHVNGEVQINWKMAASHTSDVAVERIMYSFTDSALTIVLLSWLHATQVRNRTSKLAPGSDKPLHALTVEVVMQACTLSWSFSAEWELLCLMNLMVHP